MRVLAMAARRRLLKMIGRLPDPFADSPAGLALSPSARHFSDYGQAALSLRYATTRPADVLAWQNDTRAKLAELSGYRREAVVPVEIHESWFDLPGGLRRQRVYLRAREGVDIPIHIIRPTDDSVMPKPVMICLQGTNSGAHLSWGEVRFPADLEKSGADYAIAIQAANRGYIAVAIEQSCFGERTERQIRPRSAAPCVDATMHALLLGRSLIGERCSDVSAVIDWLQHNSNKLGADKTRIYAMGHSAGGSVAMFTAALDERVSAVLACGCVGFIRQTIARRRDEQGQNVIPGILNWMEVDDVIGLIAPRLFVTVAGAEDPIWPAHGAEAVIESAATIYAAMQCADAVRAVSEGGGHYFRPAVSWQAFDDMLKAVR